MNSSYDLGLFWGEDGVMSIQHVFPASGFAFLGRSGHSSPKDTQSGVTTPTAATSVELL